MNFLEQHKLTREEWNNLEKPINNEKEKQILKMIDNGYHDINIVLSFYHCLQYFLKIDAKFDDIVFDNILLPEWEKINKHNIFDIKVTSNKNKKNKKGNLSKADKIKLEHSLEKFKGDQKSKENIIEFIIIDNLKKMSKIMKKYNEKNEFLHHKNFGLYIYNINKLIIEHGKKINTAFLEICESVLYKFLHKIDYKSCLKYIPDYLEHNSTHNYLNYKLYDHQKEIYTLFKNNKDNPKFIWYCAPTSSGKTLTPIGLTNEYKVLFVCASKHVGLSLAKSAYFCGKKIGFAFGCHDVEDIRLNYNAVNSYNETKSGRKIPDHSDGSKVEMLLCDLLSFESAMYYMKAFFPMDKIVLFWDEPTIGLDHETHYLHSVIQHIWNINKFANIVFSCATLPKRHEIMSIVHNYEEKYPHSIFKYIDVHDQFSNLMIYDEHSNVIMPHNYFKDYNKMTDFLSYQQKKYYKFYNCDHCAKFILFYNKYFDKSILDKNFNNIEHLDLNYIKYKYIDILLNIDSQSKWDTICEKYEMYNKKYDEDNKNTVLDIGTELTTCSAKSLTNGPTLYVTNKIDNISKYLLMKSNIDTKVLDGIEDKINRNNDINDVLLQKQKDYEDKTEKYKDNENVMTNMRFPQDILDLYHEIQVLQDKIQQLQIENKYIPNTKDHYQLWNNNDEVSYSMSDVYCSSITDSVINNISQLSTLHHKYKILLLMGIGVFSYNTLDGVENQHYSKELHDLENNDYVEIMKYLAENKELYLILAHSDYIYGTNYQFSHCYLGKDMKDLSQEKIIQCIGRIGRQDKNKHFSFRFRCPEQIDIFYSIPKYNIEAHNMNRLFV